MNSINDNDNENNNEHLISFNLGANLGAIGNLRLNDLMERASVINFEDKRNKKKLNLVFNNYDDTISTLELTYKKGGKELKFSEFQNFKSGSKEDKEKNKELIKDLCKEGMSQKEVAIKTGISQSYVSQILNGKTK